MTYAIFPPTLSVVEQFPQRNYLYTTSLHPTDLKIRFLLESLLSIHDLEKKGKLEDSVANARCFLQKKANDPENYWYQYIVAISERGDVSLDKIGFLDSNDHKFKTDIMEIFSNQDVKGFQKEIDDPRLIFPFSLGSNLREEIDSYRCKDPNFFARYEKYMQMLLTPIFTSFAEQIDQMFISSNESSAIQKILIDSERAELILLHWFDRLLDVLIEDPSTGASHLLSNKTWILSLICKNLDINRRECSVRRYTCAPTLISSLEMLLKILNTLYRQNYLTSSDLLDFLLPMSDSDTYNTPTLGSIILNFFSVPSIANPYIFLLTEALDQEYLQPRIYKTLYQVDYDWCIRMAYAYNLSFLKRLDIAIERVDPTIEPYSNLFQTLKPLFEKLQSYRVQEPKYNLWTKIKIWIDPQQISLHHILTKFKKLETKIAKEQHIPPPIQVAIHTFKELKEEIPVLKENYHERLKECRQENVDRKKKMLIYMKKKLKKIQEELQQLEQWKIEQASPGILDILFNVLGIMFESATPITTERQIHYAKEAYRKEIEALKDSIERKSRWDRMAALTPKFLPLYIPKSTKRENSVVINIPAATENNTQEREGMMQRLQNIRSGNIFPSSSSHIIELQVKAELDLQLAQRMDLSSNSFQKDKQLIEQFKTYQNI